MRAKANKNYTEIRGQLAHRGVTLRTWALRKRLPVGSVYNAVKGSRNGPDAVRIRAKLAEFINENEPS
jgi:hypothetical protein